MNTGSYDEIWGYTCKQIEEYFLLSGLEGSGNTYYAEGCRIMLETLPDRCVGKIALPRTRVRMEGPGCESFHQAFLLHFLSGGG